jgi:hypothetical protein
MKLTTKVKQDLRDHRNCYNYIVIIKTDILRILYASGVLYTEHVELYLSDRARSSGSRDGDFV